MTDQLPLGLMLVDPPGRYDTLGTWEQYLAELVTLPPSVTRNAAISSARELIQQGETILTKAATGAVDKTVPEPDGAATGKTGRPDA